MKTIIEIHNDYNSNDSSDYYKEELQELTTDMEIYVTVDNRMFNCPLKDKEGEKENFRYRLIVSAKGYSQSEWQVYNVYHNDKDDEKLAFLTDLLEKSFTHYNDYIASKFERQEINGKEFSAEPHDYTNFSIRDIEFPTEEDVLNAYTEMYGKDYDEVIVSID
jgi:hypothetical protein